MSRQQGMKVVGTRAPVIWLLIAGVVIIAAIAAVVVLVVLPQAQKKQEAAARLAEAERHYQAGIAFQNVGDWVAAEGEYKQVILLDAGYRDTQPRLAEVKAQLAAGVTTATAEAVVQAEKARADADATATARAQATTDALEAQYQRGLGYINLGKWANAKVELDQVFAASPNYKDTQAKLAEVEAKLQELSQVTPTPTPKPADTALPTQTPGATPTQTRAAGGQADDAVWHGEYFANNEYRSPPAYERDDARINFDWGDANPAPGVDKDNFSIRWTRCLNFEERYYVFTGQADDYIEVRLDDTVILSMRMNPKSQKFYVKGGRHCLKVLYREDSVKASISFDFEMAEKPTAIPSSDQAWHGEYFANNEFRNPSTYERDDAYIDFNWELANPAPGVDKDNFTIRWTRCLDFEERYYLFRGKADDYLEVWLDDIQVMNSRMHERTQKMYVSAGSHCLKLKYREDSVDASAYFSFEPAEQPTPVGAGDVWQGEYFNNDNFDGRPAYTRQDAWIDFDWGEANPAPGVGFDNFSIRWTRCIQMEERSYTFNAKADDNIVVLMDGTEIINAGQGLKSQKLEIVAGKHCFEVRYREAGVGAWVYFWWE